MNGTGNSAEQEAHEARSTKPDVGAATGLFRSLTALAATLVTLAQTRLELMTTELQEEVQRAAVLVVWALVALIAGMLALILSSLCLVFIFWDTHRVLTATLVSLTFITMAGIALLVLLSKLKARPRFLDATLNELARDGEALKTKVSRL
jgi:uncharacterized membrane protein YqjE